jgi:hypothetical protein
MHNYGLKDGFFMNKTKYYVTERLLPLYIAVTVLVGLVNPVIIPYMAKTFNMTGDPPPKWIFYSLTAVFALLDIWYIRNAIMKKLAMTKGEALSGKILAKERIEQHGRGVSVGVARVAKVHQYTRFYVDCDEFKKIIITPKLWTDFAEKVSSPEVTVYRYKKLKYVGGYKTGFKATTYQSGYQGGTYSYKTGVQQNTDNDEIRLLTLDTIPGFIEEYNRNKSMNNV